MNNHYPKKTVQVPTFNTFRESDAGKPLVLDVRNLGIDFGGLTAVDSFNVSLGPTEICGLIGPNGAGKTTIFNLLTGVYQPTRGSVLINGIDTKGMPTHKVTKLGIARTFQNIRLFTDMTVLDNVKVGMHNQVKCSFISSMLHLPGYFKAEKKSNEKALELIEKDEHDLIAVYNGNYDHEMHLGGPEGETALKSLEKNCRDFDRLMTRVEECWKGHDTLAAFAMDHGCHEIDGNLGSHGLDMPEDLNVVHFYGAFPRKKD